MATRWHVWRGVLAALLTVSALKAAESPSATDGTPIRVMSFNVLCSFCKPVEYGSWQERLPYFADIFKRFDPDLLGIQELAKTSEVEQFKKLLGNYEAIYFEKGALTHPDATIFYRRDRFEVLNSGVYWLSPKPDTPLSTGFIKRFQVPRCVVWATLKDLRSGTKLFFVTTHFDANRPNQEISAPLLLERTAKQAADLPIIVTGDFNSNPESKAYEILTKGADDGFCLKDAYVLSPEHHVVSNQTPEPKYNPAARIDHIFVSGTAKWKVTDWTVDLSVYGDKKRYPSDHWPIVADVAF
jgi:endonuclease/exonuclease/phosphatase family metal-dependent hydrolase